MSSTSSLNTEKDVTSQSSLTCSAGSPGCSKTNGEEVNNGVISGPGTGSIPIDESSSGSYLGLKIPGDSGMEWISHDQLWEIFVLQWQKSLSC